MSATVLHDAALADGTSGSLRLGVSVRLERGKIAWIRPNDDADTTGAVLVHGDPLSDPRALWRVWSVYQRGVRIA